MLADGADQSMMLTRVLDNEDSDAAFLNQEVSELIAAAEIMFVDGRCVHLFGYTSLMLETLKEPIVFAAKDRMNSVGCAAGVPLEVVKRCLGRMSCWVQLLRATAAAEFPSFDLLSAITSVLLNFDV